LRTLDGCEVTLRANIELPAEYEGIRRYGARGIGLYRSEFLLSHDGVLPSEEEQCAAYIKVAQLAGADGATIRLFDLGGEKIGLAEADSAPRNPALGLRAIRFALQQEDVLRTQVRALLRAAAHKSLRIVLPMISDVAEVRCTRVVINEERERLESEGHQTGMVEIGAMIEVPSAVFVADKLAREVDFFSLGTNDLVQYLLAVDRSNDQVADWFRSLHPAVLQSIRLTLDAARRAGIPAVVCGEMAATPTYAFVLLGLGARDLSMSAAAIPRIRYTIARIDAASAERIVTECLECASADEVEALIYKQLGEGWPHLFPPEILPAPKNKE
jgi:phosphotransferase system enzyme I (PtsI)